MTSQAPKLSPTFAVFVAGHRSRDLPKEPEVLETIEQCLSKNLSQLKSTLTKTVAQSPLIYGEVSPDQVELRILSRGWEGSDHMAMKVAKSLDLPLQLITTETYYAPLQATKPAIWNPKTDRAIVFDHVESEFTHYFTEDLSDEAHLAISDIVVLIWSGEVPNQFSATLKILRDAIKLGRSVIWIDFNGQSQIINSQIIPATLRRSIHNGSLNTIQLKEHFQNTDDYLLNNLLLFSNPLIIAEQNQDDSSGVKFLRKYFTRQRRFNRLAKWSGRLDSFVESLFSFNFSFKTLVKDMSQPYYAVKEPEDSQMRCTETEPENLEQRFNWSDSCANVSAGNMRDTILVSYSGFAALVLFFSYLESHFFEMSRVGQIVSAGVIVLFGLSIIGLIIIGRRFQVHHNWMSHRFIAEQLRYLRAGLPFLTFQAPVVQAPFELRKNSDGKPIPVLLSFEQWILKRTLVEAFFSSTQAEVIRPMQRTKKSLDYISSVISGQHSYHDNNAKKKLGVLTISENGVAVLTGLSLFGAIIAYFSGLNWIFTVTAFLPALAAIMKGILKEKEIKRIYLLSEESEKKLAALNGSIGELNSENLSQPCDWLKLRGLANEAIVTMSDVNDQWQQVIRIKDAKFPD